MTTEPIRAMSDADLNDRLDEECISCAEDPDPNNPMDCDNYKCSKSKRPCGHHCNHSWSHEECCWCGTVFVPLEEEINDKHLHDD